MSHALADALVPIFVGLLIGYFAGLWGVMDNQNVRTLITFVMSFAVPAALFLAITHTPSAALLEQTSTALVLTVAYVVLYAISFFWARFAEIARTSDSAVVALTISFPNVAAVGLPLLAAVYGPTALVSVAMAIALGSVTISPMTLALLETDQNDSSQGLSMGQIGLCLLRSLKKPIVWAPLLGLAFSFANLGLPSFVDHSLAVMGTAATGSALVLTGLVVSAEKFEFGRNVFVAVLLKNVLQPALALGVALLIHLPMEQACYVTLISAIPCGFFGIVFGKGFGSSPKLASSGLIASNVIGIGTLAAWIAILNQLR